MRPELCGTRRVGAGGGRAARLAAGVLLTTLALSLPAAADPSPKRLSREIARVVARPELAAAFWGVEVRSLSTGRTLYSLNAARGFRPASTFKLVTTAATLDAFGSAARLRTTVETAARQDGHGRILGDVYLVGAGDPNLSARFSPGHPTAALEAMADQLVAAGVTRIEGRMVGYDGAFSGDPRGHDWTWEDLVWGYGARVSALSWHDNVVDATLAPGERVGDPAVIDLDPTRPPFELVSSVATAGRGTDADVRLAEDDEGRVALSGQLPLGGEWKGELAVRDPALYAATAFARVLESRGIHVGGEVVSSRAALPEGRRVLAFHDSETIADIVRVVNKESQNLHAEMLLRLLGLRVAGEGSVEQGHQAILAFLERSGVPTDGWELSDGSGLARTDLLTPRGLVALLVAMDRHTEAAAFRDSLPIAGRDGTLEHRMRGTAAEGRVIAKTGTLNLANALAGYATTTRGDRLAFVAFVNDNAGRAKEAVAAIDAIAEALASAR
jgi:D-alanyl-D-alanine carboxypeptidase/D-alanyl-D-alanine-endopeptidase (penicillin-binding protein 4)